LSVDENGFSTDQGFDQMIDTVDTNTVFILNNTKVVKARLVLHNVLCVNPA
jgi:S-adenosylmethionine:tRNA-ribosyltransferase-isomerase (queuine synthetase)